MKALALLVVVLTNLLIVFTNLALFPVIGWWDLLIDAAIAILGTTTMWPLLERSKAKRGGS